MIAILSLVISAVVGVYAIMVTRRNEEAEEKAERRRFFAILWDRFTPVNDINPNNPIEVDVRYAINFFELVALSWQANVVDREMVALAFGAKYNIICGQIEQITTKLPTLGQTGAEILSAHSHIQAVRSEINTWRQKRSSLT